MNILYYSVHQILEFDEIGILQRLGHEVFSLGSYFEMTPIESFRPTPPLSPNFEQKVADFRSSGGHYHYGGAPTEFSIPAEFVAKFDCVIVMHDLDFIETHWEALSTTTVIWRSIGVGIQFYEPRVAALRAKGLKIVRYCPTENRAIGYAGHDAVIRFGKPGNPLPWSGGRTDILTFAHAYRQRFPVEYDFYCEATRGFRILLGGDGNHAIPGALGVVDFPEQARLYSACAAYFYASNSPTPYTLNFMEAWLAGIPVVAIDCRGLYPPDQCRFAEIHDLITHSENGYLVRTPAEAASTFADLLNDPAAARRIGAAGAKAAHALFSEEIVGPQWQALLATI